MKFTNLGRSGLKVSKVCFGCMTIGDRSPMFDWMMPEEEARKLIRQGLELGVNFFDTANAYAHGTSERQLGAALNDFAVREEVVIATKCYFALSNAPNSNGLSRKTIFSQCDASLQRLGTDYIDLYQIHRWDNDTPIEETMEALHDLIKQGKVRYIGASTMSSWQFEKAQQVAERNGWTKFISMQNQISLLYREEEREMIPLCEESGVDCIPWSPLARGRLTRDWNATSERSEKDLAAQYYQKAMDAIGGEMLREQDRLVAQTVATIADERGLSRAQIGLAWLHAKPAVAAPIIGVGKELHLTDAVAAADVALSPEDIARLEEHYIPHPIVGADPRPAVEYELTIKG